MSDPHAVVVATLAAHSTPLQFTKSWGDMLQYDAVRGQHLMHRDDQSSGGGTMMITSGPRIAEARSQLVDAFFTEPLFAEAGWLLMVDSDMTYPANLVEQLMAHADPEKVPILGGLCFAGGRDHSPYPTIYREVLTPGHDGKEFPAIEPVRDYPPDALVKVGATGGACLLVHRQVFIAMSHPWPKGFGTHKDGSKNPYPWFVEGLVAPNGEPIGEDVAFCRRATQLGIPIHVHTGVKLGHIKSYELDEAYFLAAREARDAAARQLLEGLPENTPEGTPGDRTNGDRAPAAERRAAARNKLAEALG